MSRNNLLGYDRANPIDLVTTDPSAPRPASAQSESVGFLASFPAAWRENFLSEAAHAAIAPAFPVDPNWSPKRTDIDAVTEGIDENLWYKYENAVSADHLYSIYIDNLSRMDRRRTIQQAGWSGVFARVVAELPEQAIIGILSGGLGSVAGATRAARFANYARAGFLAGVPAAGMEAFRASVNPDIKGRDVAIAGLSAFGGTVGGAIGSSAGGGFFRVGAGVGIGSALPTPIIGGLTGMDRNEIILGSSAALLVGGAFGGLGGMAEARGRIKPQPASSQAAEAALREIHDRATVIDAVLGVLDRRPKMATGLTDMPLVSMSYATLDDITSPGGFATLKEYFGPPPDQRLGPIAGRLSEFPDLNPQGQATARTLSFGLEATPDQVARRQTAITGLRKLDGQEQARLDALDRLFPGAEELQAQAVASNAEAVAGKRAVTDGRTVDIIDANDIDPLFADTLGLTVDELKATLEANFTRKFAKEFGYTFSRKRMEAKRAGVLEMVEALDDDLPAGVTALTSDDINAKNSPFDARLNTAAEALADAANPPSPAMGAASPNDPAFVGDPGTTAPLDNLEPGMFLVHTIGDEVPWAAGIRKWTSARAMKVVASASKNPIARIAANVLGFDNISRVDARTGELVGVRGAGGRWAEFHSEGMNNPYQVRLLEAYNTHRKMGGTLSEAEFAESVAKAVRRFDTPKYAEYENIPGIKEGVAAYQESASKPSAAVMYKHGITGAETTANPNHVLREWLQWKIREMSKKYGYDEVIKALAKAYSLKNPDDPPEIAALVARYIHKNGGSHEYRHPGLDMLDGELEVVLKTMTDQGEKDALVKLFRERVAARKAQKGVPTALRDRIDLDEAYVHTTARGEKFAIEDLLENNIAVLGKKQIRRAHGSVVHKELMRRLSVENGVQLKTIDDLKKYLQITGKKEEMSDFAIGWDIAHIEAMYRDAVGIPRVTDPKFLPIARVGRMIRSALRSTLLTSHYYTATNAGEPTSHLVTDIKTAAPALIPAISELAERSANGTLSNKNARMFEFMTGRGSSWISERTHVIETPTSGVDAALAKIENAVSDTGRFASRLTLAQQTQDYFYRVMGDEMQHRIGEWILSGKRPNSALLREFGWTDAQWDLIAKSGRPHVESMTGPNGRKYLVLNQEKWSPEAFSFLEAGIWASLDNGFTNPGSASRSWLSNSEVGRFLFQFRDFMFFSLDTKWATTAFAFMEGDKATAAARFASRFVAGAIWSYALYSIATYIKSLGRPDAEEYRQKKMENAWAIAVGRTSYSAVIPAVVDGARSMVGADPIFSAGRASGIQGGGLGSIPVVDFANRSIPAMGKLVRRPFVEDEDISVQDVMAATRGIPFFFQYEPLTKGVEYFARNVMKLPEKPKQ